MKPVNTDGSLVTTGLVRDMPYTAWAQPDFPAHPCLSASVEAAAALTPIVKIKMDSVFTATLFRSSEPNRRGRVIIGAEMCT